MQTKDIFPIAFEPTMTLTEQSWFVVEVTSYDKPKITFYTPGQDLEDPKTFTEFAEAYFDENFKFSVRDGGDMTFNENDAHAGAAFASEEEDYDDETRKSFKTWVPDGQVINIYKNKKLEDLSDLVKKSTQLLDTLEQDAKINQRDQQSISSNPEKHYGVKKSNFF